MESPILQKLDLFRRTVRHLAAEFAFESVFLTSAGLFLFAAWLDYGLWRWKFWEFPTFRLLFFLLFLAVLFWEIRNFYRLWKRLPKTRLETLNYLRAMNHQIHPKSDQLEQLQKIREAENPKISVPASVQVPAPLPPRLESAFDFLENPQPPESQELAQAVIRQTESEMEKFDAEAWVNLESFRRFCLPLRLGTFFAVLLLGILAVQCSENVPAAAGRFACPWAEIPWKAEFGIRWKTCPESVLYGEAFEGEITFLEKIPYVQAVLWEGETPVKILQVKPILGRCRIRIPNVTKPFAISLCSPGDPIETGVRKQIQVRTYPQLTNALIRIQPPAALNLPPAESSWDISGLTGSRAGIMIAVDRPLKSARLRFTNSTYIPGVPAGKNVSETGNSVFKFRFELLQDCEYFLELTDMEGLTANLERHSLRVTDDQPPKPLCTSPSSGRFLLPGAKITLTLEAQDDFGLESIGFRWVPETPLSKSPNVKNTSSKKTVSENAASSVPEGTFSQPQSSAARTVPSQNFNSNDSIDGFTAVRSRDGTPKWTGFTVWSSLSENANSNEKENSVSSIPENSETSAASTPAVSPRMHQVNYEWDLASIPLEAGMRLRAEPFANDFSPQRAFGKSTFFYVVSPEEMQLKAFRQWIGITQEMRRMAALLHESEKRVRTTWNAETIEETSAFLRQTLQESERLLHPQSQEALPYQIAILERDFKENPEFSFHENVSSKEQLEVLQNLRQTLDVLQSRHLPRLNQASVALAKELALQKPEERRLPSLKKRLKIVGTLTQILEILTPYLKIWNREERLEAMRFEFQNLWNRQKKAFEKLEPALLESPEFSPMQIRARFPNQFQFADREFWELCQETETFFTRFGDVLEPVSEEFLRQNQNSADSTFSENPEDGNWSDLSLNQTLPPLASQMIRAQEQAFEFLKQNRFWDLQRLAVQMERNFTRANSEWIQPVSENPLRETLQIFSRMAASQEKILQMLERKLDSYPQIDKNSVDAQKIRVALTRNFRSAFNDCAEIQQGFSSYFSTPQENQKQNSPQSSPQNFPDSNSPALPQSFSAERRKAENSTFEKPIEETDFWTSSENLLVETLQKKIAETLPRALTPLWKELDENLQLSIAEFRAIALSPAPPLEMLQDQFTIQLQIYDQLAELAQIADGIPTVAGEWSPNSDFENRLADSPNEEKGKASENSGTESDDSLGETDSSDKNSSENADSPMNDFVQINPEDILVLISMQTSILEYTKKLREDTQLPAEEKAAEVEFLTEQERKVAASADLLGFGTKENSSFDSLLAQMYQVVFLLEKQDLGNLTVSIQEEILYGLHASLQKKEEADDSQNASSSNARKKRAKEDLSQNMDSQAGNFSQDEQQKDQHQTEKEGESSKEKDEEEDFGKNASETESALEVNPSLKLERDPFEHLKQEAWGELPQRRLEELNLMPQAKPIPEYQKMLEIYYQNLKE